jgi:hypothetical protein
VFGVGVENERDDGEALREAALCEPVPVNDELIPEQPKEAIRSRVLAKRAKLASRDIL